MSDDQPDRGRLGTEDTPHGSARDGRTRGKCVAPDNPGDRTCNPTEGRARRAPSPRAVRDHFNPECEPTTAEGAKP